MSPGDRSLDAIGLMRLLSVPTAAAVAEAHEVLSGRNPQTTRLPSENLVSHLSFYLASLPLVQAAQKSKSPFWGVDFSRHFDFRSFSLPDRRACPQYFFIFLNFSLLFGGVSPKKLRAHFRSGVDFHSFP